MHDCHKELDHISMCHVVAFELLAPRSQGAQQNTQYSRVSQHSISQMPDRDGTQRLAAGVRDQKLRQDLPAHQSHEQHPVWVCVCSSGTMAVDSDGGRILNAWCVVVGMNRAT